MRTPKAPVRAIRTGTKATLVGMSVIGLILTGCSETVKPPEYPDVRGHWEGWRETSSATADHVICNGQHTRPITRERLPFVLDLQQTAGSVNGTASHTWRNGTVYDFTVTGGFDVIVMTLTTARQNGTEQCTVITCSSEVREHVICRQQFVYTGTVQNDQSWDGTWTGEGFDDHGLGPFTTRGNFKVTKRR